MAHRKPLARVALILFSMLCVVWGAFAVLAAVKSVGIRSRCDEIDWCAWLARAEFDETLDHVPECEFVCLFPPYVSQKELEDAGVRNASVARELSLDAASVEAPHLALLGQDFHVIYHKAFRCPGRGPAESGVRLIERRQARSGSAAPR